MRVAVTGATGTVGSQLVRELRERGDQVTVLSRDTARARSVLGDVDAVQWADPVGEPAPVEALAGHDAVIHLLGEPVAQRWTEPARAAIRASRVSGTRNQVEGLLRAEPRPGILLSSSAVGWYGPRGSERLDESAPPAVGDFLADVCVAWEREAQKAEELGARVTTVRTGVVMSPSGGALEKMLPPFKLGVGGPVAGGEQYVPWIHLDDLVGIYLFCLDEPSTAGPVNATAPEPVTNKELSKTLGRVLRRPAVAPVPAFAIHLLYGEMSEIVTTGQRAVPSRLLDAGYSFRQPKLEAALRAATGRE
jgi:uncharacterized protein (TIGR01777 family)